jgi:hypothetical protein
MPSVMIIPESVLWTIRTHQLVAVGAELLYPNDRSQPDSKPERKTMVLYLLMMRIL